MKNGPMTEVPDKLRIAWDCAKNGDHFVITKYKMLSDGSIEVLEVSEKKSKNPLDGII